MSASVWPTDIAANPILQFPLPLPPLPLFLPPHLTVFSLTCSVRRCRRQTGKEGKGSWRSVGGTEGWLVCERERESIERASASGDRGMGMARGGGGGREGGSPTTPSMVWHVTTNIAFRQSGSSRRASERAGGREGGREESDAHGTTGCPTVSVPTLIAYIFDTC